MDNSSLFQFISVVFTGSIISMLFPDGKYKNILKMLLSFVILLSVFSFFFSDFSDISFDFSSSEYKNTETFAENDGLRTVITILAKKEAEKLLSEKFGVSADSIEFSVVEYDNDYYLEKVEISFLSLPEDVKNLKREVSEKFGIPVINIAINEVIKDK